MLSVFGINGRSSKKPSTVFNSAESNLNFLDFLNWAIKKEMRRATVLKGLFASESCKGLSTSVRFLKENNLEELKSISTTKERLRKLTSSVQPNQKQENLSSLYFPSSVQVSSVIQEYNNS